MRFKSKPMVQRFGDVVNVALQFEPEDIRELAAIFENIDTDTDYSLKIDKKSAKRSLDANAYAWVLISKLAKAQNLTNDEVYIAQVCNMSTYNVLCLKTEILEDFKRTWNAHGLGWVVDTFDSKIPGCTNVRAFYGSSAFNRQEMSQFIDNLIYECNELRIPIDERMINIAKEQWE